MRALGLVILVLALATGCAEGPPARAWASSVCSALTPWRAEIVNLTTQAQQLTPQSATPQQAKENLVRMLGGAYDASEQARKKVVDAGVPEVEGGDAVAAGVVASLTKVRDAYGRARSTVDGLPTADAEKFYTGVSEAMGTLQTEYAASALDTSALKSSELQAAFTEVPECR